MLEGFSMIASHSRRPVEEDIIFKVSREAGAAASKYGINNIINASVGSLLDDTGKLAVIPAVIETLRGLDAEDFSAYAPIAGLPKFLECAKKAVFRNCEIKGYAGAVATPGGTGAIRHTIWNYTEYGDTVLTADWYWGPYRNISEEHGRRLETFSLFDNKYNFNTASFGDKVDEIICRQGRIVILFNFPANNPTGYDLSEDEWDGVLNILKAKAQDSDNRIILFIDIAYIDYSGKPGMSRNILSKLDGLPQNILVVFGFSMSKSYTLYGMRSGAMIGLSSSEDISREFGAICEFSNRGTWSNGTRPAMALLVKIFSDEELFERVEREREGLRRLLEERSSSFITNSQKVGLPLCPYKSGFFISIPCNDPKSVAERLKEDNIFAVPISHGIRFAICSVSQEHCAQVPEKIMKALNI